MKTFGVVIGVLVVSTSMAQLPSGATMLSREALVQLVLRNHPMARQAGLRTAFGEASVQSARGGFDPMAIAGYKEKRFDDKDYFTLLDAGLKVPTWFGVELLGGFQQNSGIYLDPSGTTPDDGLIKAGVSVPIGQGLFIDQRRATLRKAQAYERATEGERQQMLNQLLLSALNDHTDWVMAFEQMRISDTAVVLARERFQQVRGSFVGGDRPGIDTLEAWLQVQDRTMRQQQARLNFRNASLRLGNHLWDDAQRPLELLPEVVPDRSDLDSPATFALADTAIARAIEQHPVLLQSRARIEQLEVDRRLRMELLKPELDVEYQWLGNGGALDDETGTTLLGEGHQLGVGFKVPLFLRKERGELTLARLRRTDADLGLERDRTVLR
ncbi:MAG: TolC family protein, partial [Flavobacteriales bacterium]|nr:TolC family protein [Flavobacteriales bacterium]